MNQFRRHMIASAILALPFALIGCNGEGDSSSSENGGGSNVSAKAPILTPVMLSQALPVNQATMIDLSSAIISGDGENYLSRLALSPRASEGCDESPVISNHKVSVTPQDGSGEVLMCSYDYTVGEGKLSATSTLAFAAVDGKTLTPSLPWLGGVGSVGEAIEVTVAAEGALNANVIVLGDTTTDPDVDTTAKTITFTGNELGVTRVMYTVTDPTSNETKVGIIDFTVSADINTAPTASRGDITIAKDTVTTITLSSF
ncbi:hypothetical protein NQN45_004339, partial [Vibrio vulnificus]|nr:hypothetical protein [Vibrio vulnificus]